MRGLCFVVGVACGLGLLGQGQEVKEIRLVLDPAGKVRPGETVVVQGQVWGVKVEKDGSRKEGRLRTAAKIGVKEGDGWVSKPFRYQGNDSGGYVEAGGGGFASIFQGVSGQFLVKDSVAYTAPEKAGKYVVEGEAGGVKGTVEIEVDESAPSRRAVEKTEFGVEPYDGDRFRTLAGRWSPYVAQETWFQWKADVPARFDFDGDWKGDNNWDRMEEGSSQAYVYYAGVETATHWFLHFNFFHPRDYSDNCVAGTCHENDNEGIILTIRKDGTQFGKLEVMETLAHNHVYSYVNEPRLRKGAHDVDGKIEFFEETHPIVFIEAGGHGVLGSAARQSTFSASRMDFLEGTGMTFYYKGKAERARHGNDRNVGYQLLPISTHWWERAKAERGNEMFDAYFDYEPYGGRPGGVNRYAGAFLGRKFGANKAKPFWGWHDERTRKGKILSEGQWALDPAYAVTRNLTWPRELPVALDYTFNPYLGVKGTPETVGGPSGVVPPAGAVSIAAGGVSVGAPGVATPARVGEAGQCQAEAVIDGTAFLLLRGREVTYEVVAGQKERGTSAGCSGELPTGPVSEFRVAKNRGRGEVKVVEPPGAGNGWTGKVQIDDPQRGADKYVIVIQWKP